MTTKSLTDDTGRRSLDPKHAPVSLPPGSFDLDALTKGLNKATTAAAEKRDGVIAETLKTAGGIDPEIEVDPSDQPGFKTVEVEHESIPGLIETVRVFDPKAADAVTTEGDKPKNEGE